jgi:RND family efflux transporter MFP subunit
MSTGKHLRRLFIATLAMLAAACGAPSETESGAAPASVDVRVGRAVVRPLTRTFEAGGVIKARTTAQLSSRIAAELRELKVRPGDRVAKGQIVAVLDDRDLSAHRAQAHASLSAAQNGAASAEAAREAAEAGLALAQANHRRIEQLRARNSATPQELDRAIADLRMAEAALRAAAARRAEASDAVSAAQAASRAADVTSSFSMIAAPFDGLVTSRGMEPGNMAAPGVPLLTVETADGFRLEVQVDEARARSLQMGDIVAVELERFGDVELEEGGGRLRPDTTVTGRIVEIARSVDPVGHTFLVKVQLPPTAAVRSGMFARARFESEERKALVVPASAIVRRGQLSLVFIVDSGGRARMRAITAGSQSGDTVEVLAGLQAGEPVIVNPPAALVEGTPVRATGGQP